MNLIGVLHRNKCGAWLIILMHQTYASRHLSSLFVVKALLQAKATTENQTVLQSLGIHTTLGRRQQMHLHSAYMPAEYLALEIRLDESND